MIVLVSRDGYVKRMHFSIARSHRMAEAKRLNINWFKILMEPEGDNDLVLLTNMGGVVRFLLGEIRVMGELSPGVRAIKLQEHESIQDAIIVRIDRQDGESEAC